MEQQKWQLEKTKSELRQQKEAAD
jgi:hypothetical protein